MSTLKAFQAAFILYEQGRGTINLSPEDRLDTVILELLLEAKMVTPNPKLSHITDGMNLSEIRDQIGALGFSSTGIKEPSNGHEKYSTPEEQLTGLMKLLCCTLAAQYMSYQLWQFRDKPLDLNALHMRPEIYVLTDRHSLSEIYFLAWISKRELALDIATMDVPRETLGAKYAQQVLRTSAHYLSRGYAIQSWERPSWMKSTCLEAAIIDALGIENLDEKIAPTIEITDAGVTIKPVG